MDWFRMYGEFATDPKVQMLSEAMQRRLVMLFCLECSNGIETFHVTERETSIAFALRVSEADLAETKALFLRKNFINEDWTLCNWSKRQYASDSSTARVRAYREKKKKESAGDETDVKRSSNAPEQNRTDTDKPINLERGAYFAMPLEGWEPAPKSFKAICFANSIKPDALTPEQLAAFCSYWSVRPEKEQSQAQWEYQLVQHLNNQAQYAKASGSTSDGYSRTENASAGQRSARKGPMSAPDRVRAAIAERDAREAAAGADGQAMDQDVGDVRPSVDGEFRRIG